MKKEELISRLTDKQKEYDWHLLPEEFTYSTPLQYVCHKKDELGNEHGVQTIRLGKILRGDGCPICRGKGMTKELFVYKANLVHNYSYIYDKFEFADKRTKGTIYCPKHNIEFQQSPSKHLSGQGCPKCRYKKSAASNTKTTEEFIDEAKKIWGDRWIYTDAEYKKGQEKISIICPIHGKFWITPNNHIHKSNPQGCPQCGKESSINNRTMTFLEFAEVASKIHNNKYKYIESEFTKASDAVGIICPIHGKFYQKGINHTCLKQGCPKCSNQQSLAEEEIVSFINEIIPNVEIQQRNRKLINPYEIDIVIPSYNFAIEYNGLVWHSEKLNKNEYYHLNKTAACENKGIRLIHIFEDEWLYKRDIVKSKLMEILHCSPIKISADDCEIKEITAKEYKEFIITNCIKNTQSASIRYGLFHKDELISVMAIKKANDFGLYELLSLSDRLYTDVIEGDEALFKYFIKEYKPKIVTTKVDRRWSDGKEIEKLGFSLVRYDEPNYWYVDGKHRISESKAKAFKNKDLYRIYDCGNIIFEWRNLQF